MDEPRPAAAQGQVGILHEFQPALVGLGLLAFTQFGVYAYNIGDSAKEFSNAEIYPPAGYVIGMFIMSIFLAFRYRDVRLWFPMKPPKESAVGAQVAVSSGEQ